MKIIKDLFLSLLNATMLLAIILAIVLITLISQIDGLVEDTNAAVTSAFKPQVARLERMALGIENLNQKIENGNLKAAKLAAMTSELQDINQQISQMRANLQEVRAIPLEQVAQKLTSEIGKKLLANSNQ